MTDKERIINIEDVDYSNDELKLRLQSALAVLRRKSLEQKEKQTKVMIPDTKVSNPLIS